MKINKNIIKNSRLLILILISIVLNLGVAFAADPSTTINFQGYLTDSSSSAITGTKDIQISVYEAATDGDATYVETHSSVIIDNGRFSVSIGAGTTVTTGTWPTSVDFTKALWLEITIDPSGANETLSSRIALTPAPYAQISINDSLYSVEKAGCNSSQYVKRNSSDNGWECADLTVTQDNLAADLVFDDGDLLNLSGVGSSDGNEGLILPQKAGTPTSTTEGQIIWDSTNNKLYIGEAGGIVEIGAGGVGSSVDSSEITDDTIVNADIKSDAAIAFSKLAGLTSANILVGDSGGVAKAVPLSGDVGISNTGVTSISSGAIVNDDIKSDAAIAFSKLAGLTSANILVGDSGDVAKAVPLSGDVGISNTGETSISSGVIVNADINDSAGIATSKLSETFFPTTLSSSTTLDSSHVGVILADGTGEAITLTLPAASSSNGYKYTIKNIDSNPIIIAANGTDKIDGATSISLTSQYDYVTIVCNGTAWFKVATVSSGGGSGDNLGDHTATQALKLKIFSSQPYSCDSSHYGEMVATSSGSICWCSGVSGFVGWFDFNWNACW